MLCSGSMASQGCEQCGAQVCAQTQWSGAGSEDHRDHSGEDDSPAAGGGENLHAEGDPGPQHGEGTLLNQYVGILFKCDTLIFYSWTLKYIVTFFYVVLIPFSHSY